ncbi:MAG: DMT family transporter [Alcanivoracaceae bacterium]|nr:DMT family transporter [Alcanivoracaceae bacterium]
MGLGEFLSLLCALLWAFAVIFYKRAGDHFNAYEMNLFKSAFVLLLMIPTVLLTDGLTIPAMSHYQFWIIMLSGFFGIMLADLFYLRALQLIGASLTGITGSLYSPFVVALSLLFLGEYLQFWQYVGMILVLSGVVLVGYRRKALAIEHPPIRGFVYATLAVFFTALGIVIIKPVSSELPFFWIILIRSFGGFITMIMYGLILKKSLSIMHVIRAKGGHWLILGAFIGQYLSMMVWIAGYKYTSASIASILNETASIFILILSWLMLGEYLTKRKILGVIITISGVLLVLSINT